MLPSSLSPGEPPAADPAPEAGAVDPSENFQFSDTSTALVSAAEISAETAAKQALGDDAASAEKYASASRAEATRSAYQHDLEAFASWCAVRRLPHLPAAPESVALYLAHLADAGRKPAGIDRVLSALAKAHQLAGYPGLRKHGAIAEVRAGIRRTLGTDQVRKAPLLVDALKKITKKLRPGLFGARDRALLLTGFAGAFRRSELVALDVADLVWVPEGLTILVRRSKTDQEGKGRTVPIPRGRYEATCPVRAMRAWLEAAGIAAGAIFQGLTRGGRLTGKRLADRDVARLVKRAVGSTGLDARFFAGHSLRAGLVTQAAREGKSDRKIMVQTGHRSRAMIDRYVREAELFVDNAASGLGL